MDHEEKIYKSKVTSIQHYYGNHGFHSNGPVILLSIAELMITTNIKYILNQFYMRANLRERSIKKIQSLNFLPWYRK